MSEQFVSIVEDAVSKGSLQLKPYFRGVLRGVCTWLIRHALDLRRATDLRRALATFGVQLWHCSAMCRTTCKWLGPA